MGCTVSAIRRNGSKREQKEGNDEENDEMQKYLQPAPHIPLVIGSGVAEIDENDHVLIFIFGGPGSMKGVLIEELVAEFDFKVLSAEDVVLQYLPNKVANSSATTQEIQDLLKTDPSLVQFEWIMHLMSAKLLTSVDRRYIIDIVPNISSILKADSFSVTSFGEQLEAFEIKHPINFALNLTVPGGNIDLAPGMNRKMSSQNMNGKPADNNGNGDADSSKSSTANGDKKDKDKKDAKQSIFSEGLDEGDMSRTRRRFETYRSIATPMLQYFDRTKRVVSMEVNSESHVHVQRKLRDVLLEFGIMPGLSPVTVILFVFSEIELDGLDLNYYGLIKLRLSSLVGNDKNWIEKIKFIKQKVLEEKITSNNFVVMLDNFHWIPATEEKRLSFMDSGEKEDYLDKYIPLKGGNKTPKLFKKKVKTIMSPSGETYLFSMEMKLAMCKDIATIMFDRRTQDYLRPSSNSDMSDAMSDVSVMEDSPT